MALSAVVIDCDCVADVVPLFLTADFEHDERLTLC